VGFCRRTLALYPAAAQGQNRNGAHTERRDTGPLNGTGSHGRAAVQSRTDGSGSFFGVLYRRHRWRSQHFRWHGGRQALTIPALEEGIGVEEITRERLVRMATLEAGSATRIGGSKVRTLSVPSRPG
jgi:hypothetical protein